MTYIKILKVNNLFKILVLGGSGGGVGVNTSVSSDTVDINTKKFTNEFEQLFPELFMYQKFECYQVCLSYLCKEYMYFLGQGSYFNRIHILRKYSGFGD